MSEFFQNLQEAFKSEGWLVKPTDDEMAVILSMPFDTVLGVQMASALLRQFNDGVVRAAFNYESEGRNVLESVWPNMFQSEDWTQQQLEVVTRQVVERVGSSYTRGLHLRHRGG